MKVTGNEKNCEYDSDRALSTFKNLPNFCYLSMPAFSVFVHSSEEHCSYFLQLLSPSLDVSVAAHVTWYKGKGLFSILASLLM